jgi:UDP-N-acetylglucosamine acyltransferase
MSQIHPTAIVDPQAVLGRDVKIGPYCVVGPGVVLGDACELLGHVTLLGPAEFGVCNTFYPYCVLGAAPQDLKFKGGPTRLLVGSHNVFREHVTAHRGTEVDRRSQGITRIGDHNLLMIGVHVAHDSDLGSYVLLANHVQIAGHVRIEDRVVVGGVSAMHHFVTIGRDAFVGGMTRVAHDVPPYMKVMGYTQTVRGVNTEGLRRWQTPAESIKAIKAAARLLFAPRRAHSPLCTAAALSEIESTGLSLDEHVAYLVAFMRRKLAVGVFGRAREHERSDVPTDRQWFYQRPEGHAYGPDVAQEPSASGASVRAGKLT